MKLFVVEVADATLFLLADDKKQAAEKANEFMIRKIINQPDWSVEDCALAAKVRAASSSAAVAFGRVIDWRDPSGEAILTDKDLRIGAKRERRGRTGASLMVSADRCVPKRDCDLR